MSIGAFGGANKIALEPAASHRSTTFAWGALLVLLGGVFLRLASLDTMRTMLNWDEAWDAADALSLLTHPRLTPFFLTNNGRESGWMYWLAPYIAALGAKPFAVRLAAAFAGILLLALVYRLGRELLGRAGGLWTLAGLSVLYWSVQLSHRVLRFNLYLLIGAAAAWLLLTAYRTNRRRTWLAGGVALGLLAYTYFSSATWILYLGLLTASVALLDRRRRVNASLALAGALALALPMGLYLLSHQAEVLQRPAQVSAVSASSLLDSGQHWLAAWFQQGDLNAEFNLPGRPILDLATGPLAILGLIELARRPQRRAAGLLLLGLAATAWLPSFLSADPPNFSRAAGLIIPLALVLGAGADWLARGLGSWLRRGRQPARWSRAAGLAPLLLLLWAGGATFHDFDQIWAQSTGLYLGFEQHINSAADFVRDHTPPDEAVFFSPFSAAHPDVQYRRADLAPRTVAGFASGECLVVPDRPTVFVSLTPYEPDFARQLSQFAAVTVLHTEPAANGGNVRYTILSARPHLDLLEPAGIPTARLGNQFEVLELLPALTRARPGATITVTLGIRALQPVQFAPSLFVHLYGDPTPYQGGPLWAQADSELCTSYPANLWRTNETIIQAFSLKLPASLPRGTYTLAVDIYAYPNGARLPVTTPIGGPRNYFSMQALRIAPWRRHARSRT
jgi:hypothetical protein